MDDAFLRRLDVVVDFPFPEPERPRAHLAARAAASAAPTADDIDVRFLAERFKLSGGASATARSRPRSWPPTPAARSAMEHLVRAVALEYNKLGRLTIEADFEQFFGVIRPPQT